MFAPRAYAMAVRNDLDAAVVDALHAAVLELHEMGTMTALERKWFVDKGECWNVTEVRAGALQMCGGVTRVCGA